VFRIDSFDQVFDVSRCEETYCRSYSTKKKCPCNCSEEEAKRAACKAHCRSYGGTQQAEINGKYQS